MAHKSNEFRLPHQLSEWHETRKKFRCEAMDIHNITASASDSTNSEVQIEQFLALKVLYLAHPQSQIEKYLTDTIGFAPDILSEKIKAMKTRRAWTLYINALKDNIIAIRKPPTPPLDLELNLPRQNGRIRNSPARPIGNHGSP